MRKSWKIVGSMVILACVIVVIFNHLSWMKETYQKVLLAFQKENTREINFAQLQARNPEVYAWIEIPGTKIDYPVLQSMPQEGEFYLTHDIDRESNIYGSIFSDSSNRKEFTDCNTVIYGHNMQDGSMFGTLDSFADVNFFEKNRNIIIYTPTRVYRYEIFAAYPFSDDHLLTQIDGQNKEAAEAYLELITTQAKEADGNYKEQIEMDGTSKLITLSTCTDTNNRKRFLVQGVLKNVEIVKNKEGEKSENE